MKRFRNIALLCLTALLACCKESETFYTTFYPIVRVEAATTITQPEPEKPEPENPTPAAVTAEEPTEEQKLIEAINQKVLSASPVLAGGSYTLGFTRHNGGTLTVDTASERQIGTFDKIPGKSELTFRYAEQEYTATIGSYIDSDDKRKVLLSIDLTKVYQELYPDAKISSVKRLEYTSTPSK